jgi:hypothetical protein
MIRASHLNGSRALAVRHVGHTSRLANRGFVPHVPRFRPQRVSDELKVPIGPQDYLVEGGKKLTADRHESSLLRSSLRRHTAPAREDPPFNTMPAMSSIAPTRLSAKVQLRGASIGNGVTAAVSRPSRVVARQGKRTGVRGASLRVFADRWMLKNCGPKTIEHLGEDVEIPGDFELSGPRVVVGRQASESVSLEIAVPTVSGAHAMLEVSDDAVMVTDLSSTNGTFIEGDELQAGIAYELKEGSEVIFGDEFLACFELLRLKN